jgi:hypothetical protein
MSTAEPSTSRHATVADESEELAAEAGQTQLQPAQPEAEASASTSNGADNNNNTDAGTTQVPENQQDQNGDANANGNGNGDGQEPPQEPEAVFDPNRLPEDACETLYLQNLNEKVRVPGE